MLEADLEKSEERVESLTDAKNVLENDKEEADRKVSSLQKDNDQLIGMVFAYRGG